MWWPTGMSIVRPLFLTFRFVDRLLCEIIIGTNVYLFTRHCFFIPLTE